MSTEQENSTNKEEIKEKKINENYDFVKMIMTLE